MVRAIDLTGHRYGKLSVITEGEGRRKPSGLGNYRFWVCACDCGNEAIIEQQALRSGNTKSCGCLFRDGKNALDHGHALRSGWSSTYRSWTAMIARCTRPKSASYAYYGARGIKICERWRTFSNFLADMGERPAGKTLDRIDVDGDYEPGNCRWATAKEQRVNQRGFQSESSV